MHTPGLGTVFGTLYMHNQDDKSGWDLNPRTSGPKRMNHRGWPRHVCISTRQRKIRWIEVGLVLSQRRRRSASMKPTVGEHLVFVGQLLQCLASFSKRRLAGGLGIV